MYRRVLVLAMVPLYAGLFIAATAPDIPVWASSVRFPKPLVPLYVRDRIFAGTFCLIDFLASGALIVSWGLLLATWVPRLGRAVALSVIAYFLLGIGWPLLIELLFSQLLVSQPVNWYDRNRTLQKCLMSFSPLTGPMSSINELQQYEFYGRGPIWLGVGTVIVIKSTIAGLLLWLTTQTFDHCLGRVPESRFLAHFRKSAARKEPVPRVTH